MSYFKASHGGWPANGYLKPRWVKSLYKNSCCGKGTFILDNIQTVLKEWNWTKREILFLLPASPVNDTSFHLAHFFIGIFPPASVAELLWFCGNFTETSVFQVRCLPPLSKSVLLLHLESDCQTTWFGFVKNCKSVFKLEHWHKSNLTDLWHDRILQVGFSA